MRIRLGVNVDHVATLRQARRGTEPDPVLAALTAEAAGADQITVHLREDRRHIQERDVRVLRQTVKTKLNLEMGLAEEIQRIALEVKPDIITLVPEKREEITTEGGLDVVRESDRIAEFTKRAQAAGIVVSLFVDPDRTQLLTATQTGATAVELHTGTYAEAFARHDDQGIRRALDNLSEGAAMADSEHLSVIAGHGLDYHNIHRFLEAVPHVEEVNIGHSIVARAVFCGLEQAVREMRLLLDQCSR